MDKQPLRHILNSQPSSEHRVSSKVLSIEGYYSINIFSHKLGLEFSFKIQFCLKFCFETYQKMKPKR